jgi:hypothetical protein
VNKVSAGSIACPKNQTSELLARIPIF